MASTKYSCLFFLWPGLEAWASHVVWALTDLNLVSINFSELSGYFLEKKNQAIVYAKMLAASPNIHKYLKHIAEQIDTRK
mgnify:CR=1 FL=1